MRQLMPVDGDKNSSRKVLLAEESSFSPDYPERLLLVGSQSGIDEGPQPRERLFAEVEEAQRGSDDRLLGGRVTDDHGAAPDRLAAR